MHLQRPSYVNVVTAQDVLHHAKQVAPLRNAQERYCWQYHYLTLKALATGRQNIQSLRQNVELVPTGCPLSALSSYRCVAMFFSALPKNALNQATLKAAAG